MQHLDPFLGRVQLQKQKRKRKTKKKEKAPHCSVGAISSLTSGVTILWKRLLIIGVRPDTASLALKG
jgi:hypothetical protein